MIIFLIALIIGLGIFIGGRWVNDYGATSVIGFLVMIVAAGGYALVGAWNYDNDHAFHKSDTVLIPEEQYSRIQAQNRAYYMYLDDTTESKDYDVVAHPNKYGLYKIIYKNKVGESKYEIQIGEK